jgi:hypothetical protein
MHETGAGDFRRNEMLRNIASVVIGVLVGAIVVFLVESLGHLVFPVAEGVDLHDPAALRDIMDQIPLAAKFTVLLAWFLGIFAGASVAALVARRWAPAAWVVSGTLAGMAGVTLIEIPHPWWMVLGAIFATALGGWCAVKATRSSYGRPPTKPDPMPGF